MADSRVDEGSSPALFGVLLPVTSRGTSGEVLRSNLARLGASLRSTVRNPAETLRIFVGVDHDDPLLLVSSHSRVLTNYFSHSHA